ncbi:LuxR C-terminal-related transcriptional regulator [Legionella pneumophila]|uniref:LuxR C-terminal-related transcriptional regulator n=1 Tax=Legionella pneumophila TaxID=446 RepID=UPI0022B3C324|nr:LuxR C-terminal-related transcriptional regulator [Legionella pneumophila]MCZ4721530.1 LuxR C-terminal-related transcriptional regulator [Legionella pneumophila]MCZ4729264.1 LuxR C-terminal-related transcriptional regulator [Legionella pneumophila]WBA03236.1 Putative HTH-type transcriptional regulator [Legionella pneumophila]
MTQQILYLESLPVHAYQDLNFAVFVKNLKGCYLWGNSFFISKSAGYKSLSEIYNKQDYHFAWHYYADQLRKNDQMLFENGESLSAYEQVLRHDGTIVNIVSKKSPLFDKELNLIGLVGFSIELPQSNVHILTPREYNTLLLLSEGYTDKQTAKKLGISPRTVEAHINNSKQKLGVKTRAELIAQFSRKHP